MTKSDVVMLKAGEAEYPIALSNINHLCDLESEFDLPINGVIRLFSDQDMLQVSNIRRFFRIVLRPDGPETSRADPKRVDDICAAAGLKECERALTASLISVFGKAA